MITIEQLYFRRWEDGMVFGPQDVNVRDQAECAATSSKISVTNEEEKELTSGRKKSWLLNLFRCCFPKRSASETKSDTDKRKNKDKAVNKAKVQKKVKSKDKHVNKEKAQEKAKDKPVNKEKVQEKAKDKPVNKEKAQGKAKDKPVNKEKAQDKAKDRPVNKEEMKDKTSKPSILRRLFGRKSGNGFRSKAIDDIYTEQLQYYNIL